MPFGRPVATAVGVLLLVTLRPALAQDSPEAGCIDLHSLSGAWRSAERELVIRSTDKTGARLALAANCHAFPQGVELTIVAPGGLACPGKPLFVGDGNAKCLVNGMTLLSQDQVAAVLEAREAQLRSVTTLNAVIVQGHHWRDIRGTTDYCVDARFLRGWRRDNMGLVVEVSPKRHAGHRYYRVETASRCSDLNGAHAIRLKSRSGGAAVCGHPGDKVLMVADASGGFTATGGLPPGAFNRGCEITRVTPLARD